MKIGDRFFDLSHTQTMNRQGGEYHLSAEEYDKIKTLSVHKRDIYNIVKNTTSYGVYVFGEAAPTWCENYGNTSTLYRLTTLPNKEMPLHVTTPGPLCFSILLADGYTYTYRSDTASSIPYKAPLASWKDISSTGIVSSTSLSSTYVLQETASQSKSPKLLETGNTVLNNPSYDASGYPSFTYNISGTQYTAKFYIRASQVVLQNRLNSDCVGLALAGNKIYRLEYNINGAKVARSPTYTEIPIPLTTEEIKNVWISSYRYFFVQDTDGVLYLRSSADVVPSANVWTRLGQWDVKDIPVNFELLSSLPTLMLTKDGKLYYRGSPISSCGLPSSPTTFTHIHTGYRFEEIAWNGNSFMGIGYRAI